MSIGLPPAKLLPPAAAKMLQDAAATPLDNSAPNPEFARRKAVDNALAQVRARYPQFFKPEGEAA